MQEREFRLSAPTALFKMTKEELVASHLEKEKELLRFQDKFLEKKELANRWGVSIGTVNNMLEKGMLPVYRPMPDKKWSRVLFPLAEIVAMENQGMVKYGKK